jgi:membrane protease YdiL (CAAX protease family)
VYRKNCTEVALSFNRKVITNSLSAYQIVIFSEFKMSRLIGIRKLPYLPVGFLLGTAAIGVGMSPELFSTNLKWGTPYIGVAVVVSTLFNVICTAFAEEVFYRSILMDFFLKQTRSLPVAIILQALVFVFTHSGIHWANIIDVLYYFIPAVILGIAIAKSNSLFLVTGIHAGLNWALGAFCGESMYLKYSIIDPTIQLNKVPALIVFGVILLLTLAYLALRGQFNTNSQHSSVPAEGSRLEASLGK